MRLALAFALALLPTVFATGQQTSQPSIPFPNQVPEPVLYRMLLHHAAAFEVEARRLEALHQDGSYYRRHIAVKLQLSADQAKQFMNLALGHRAAEQALEQRHLPAIQEYRDRYLANGGNIDLSNPPPPPADLALFKSERDALSLEYRDRWHSQLGDKEFARIESVIKNDLKASYRTSWDPASATQTKDGGVK